MDDAIHQLTFSDEFKICPQCGYKDGFHSAFKREGQTTKWLFICPSCHAVFDIGFTV
ncbi:MAG: transposase [Desulfuromonadales bacterium]|nr:transposase [Desulfuromonadales bacterium]